MAETPLVSGAAKEWLSARRDELNARFRAAKQRYAKLDAQNILALNAELLPPLAGKGETYSAELLSEVFDLILLHSGRGLLSLAPSPMRILLSETFPKIRALLLQRSTALPSELSNAVENLHEKGGDFAREIGAMASQFQNVGQIRSAGALLAWRLGEARLREQALKTASQLPNAIVLSALGLSDWPETTAPLALGSLVGDAWCHPRDRLSPQTLEKLADAGREKVVEMLEKLNPPFGTLPTPARQAATCGEFAGFGGRFLAPPKLLYVGKNRHRHHFWVRSGTENFRIDADIFGSVCRPDPSADFPLQETAWRAGVGATLTSSLRGSKESVLYNDGELYTNGVGKRYEALRDASSYCAVSDLLATTGRDSYRIRIFSPARPVL